MQQTLAEQWSTKLNSFKERDMDRIRMSQFRIVDIGRITQVLDNGKAIVELYDFVGTTLECEIISVGAFNNVFTNAIGGQHCIVLFPTSNVDLGADAVQTAAQPYDTRYAKCLPIGLQGGNKVVVGANEDSIDVQGDNYNVSLRRQSIVLNSAAVNASIDIQNDSIALATKEGKTIVQIGADGITVTSGNTYDAAGTQTSKSKVVISKDGKMELEGDLKITGNVEITGNLKAADGNFEATV